MKTAVLITYVIFLLASFWLKYLNLRQLKEKGRQVPEEFQGFIDEEILRKTTAYTLESSRADTVSSLFTNIVLIAFLFGGLLPVYDHFISSLSDSLVARGVLFFLGLVYLDVLLGIPFSLYKNFNIERRYGFNTMTMRTWLADLAKSTLLASIFLAVLAAAAFYFIQTSPWWWLWVWGFFLAFSLFVMYISPQVIEPLFFRFEPVQQQDLESEIRQLMMRAGLRVNRVFQMDASRRSRHSNAYFSGIGRVKRIVLFDTLLAQMDKQEILAVLAHEAGHWKRRHVMKRIILTESLALAAIYAAFRLLPWSGLPAVVGLEQASLPARLFILGFLGCLLLYPLIPVGSYLSRRQEREADRFACTLISHPRDLATALIKLARENLANLHPHPVYAAFYYSHPPLVERVRSLLGEGAPSRG